MKEGEILNPFCVRSKMATCPGNEAGIFNKKQRIAWPSPERGSIIWRLNTAKPPKFALSPVNYHLFSPINRNCQFSFSTMNILFSIAISCK